jgi:voltage-gated potassium channel Kch
LILASSILIPFQFAFGRVVLKVGSEIVYLIDFFFLIDILLNFFTSYRYHGTEITDRNKTAAHYLKTFFAIDLLANLPIDTILFFGSQDILIYNISLVLIFRMSRLLRIVRLFVIFRRWEEQSWTNSGFLRIAKFFAVVMLLIHWISCAWYLTAFIHNFPQDCWVVRVGIEDADPITQYIRSLYWAIVTMTTVGYGDITPYRNIEYLFTMVVMLLGASMYAFIIGNIASLFSKLDSSKVNHFNRMEAVTQFLRYRHVPHELNLRVRNYYEYMWGRRRGLKEEVFLRDLPEPLKLEILLHLTRELLDKVPLFKYSSPTLRNALLMALRLETYAPEDEIVREGEVGEEICFISQGKAEITANEGEIVHGTLEDGDYFGDLSLILGEKRTASVKALTYCEIFILMKEDFNGIKDKYPEIREVLKKMSSEKTDKIAALVLKGITL